MSTFSTLLVETRDDGIAIVTLNRPDKLNSLVEAMFFELGEAFKALEQDDGVRVIILTGAGEKAFCAGADIGMMASKSPIESRTMCRAFHDIFIQIENIEKPVIAAVNGYALGGGCELALICDIRVASERAKFALPEAKHGIIPGSGGTQRMTRLIGPSRAKHLMFSARAIDAQTALTYGLANEVVPPEELLPACIKMAHGFIKQSALSLALEKRAINLAADTDLRTGLSYEMEAFAVTFASEEKERRMAAFLAGDH